MKYNPWLFWFAVLTAIATFLLIGLGGLVTSHEAGMSVPDWPTSYGYNMFALPFIYWKDLAFFEHTHRLLASEVGLLTMVLFFWLFGKKSRVIVRLCGLVLVAAGVATWIRSNSWPAGVYYGIHGTVLFVASFIWPACEPSPKWFQRLGIIAFLLVIAQGILGGLRVKWQMASLGIFHGAIAQVFLILICAMALFASAWWNRTAIEKPVSVPRGLRSHVLWVTILIFMQLLIGATMRHQHTGLAIPDFPFAYGKIWPATNPEAIAHYNAQRVSINGQSPLTAFQINLQMVHRLVAVLIFLGVTTAAFLSLKKLRGGDALTKFAWLWAGLLAAQVALGIATILTNKAADIATLHVMAGAVSLVVGALWWLVAQRRTTLTPFVPAGQNN